MDLMSISGKTIGFIVSLDSEKSAIDFRLQEKTWINTKACQENTF